MNFFAAKSIQQLVQMDIQIEYIKISMTFDCSIVKLTKKLCISLCIHGRDDNPKKKIEIIALKYIYIANTDGI